ncbi:MFS transporter [Corynebacterium sp. HMSC076D02]|uniref:MFS transporter n=1 Tax=Corynebacterium sp. HMSC076D02 TaxID=1739439 RepID=UPI0008A15074|nr:MFS transporter [Corynebacterium sp. HMSC076D02]OFQ49687.1 hypothetical protein HMPREF2935_10495 [Corynebacterium sp. HMSC076D02]
MKLKQAINFNTFRFSLLYALSLSVAGIDLTISVRSGQELTRTALGGTMTYVLIALGIIIAARLGMPLIKRLGPRMVYLIAGTTCILSGMATSFAMQKQQIWLFYGGILLVGIFMGLANFHRILVKDFAPQPSPWDTSLVLLSGVVGSIFGPWVAGIVAESPSDFYKAYRVVIGLGILVFFASLALPQTIETMLARTSKDDRSGDRSTLYLGGVLGFFSYVTMTLLMTAIPLEAQRQGLSSSEISDLSQLHMVAMYLPILVVPYLINQFSAQKVAIWSLGLGGLSAVCAELLLKDEKENNLELAILMVIAGVLWAFSFTAASNIVAVNQYGRTHLVARGRAESMPPLGMIIGSILAGALLGSVGFIWVAVFFGIVSLSAFLLLTILTSLKPT